MGTETEASTLAGGVADRGGEEVEYRERGSGNKADEDDLLHIKAALAGDEDGGETDGKTLNKVLHEARDNLIQIEGHH